MSLFGSYIKEENPSEVIMSEIPLFNNEIIDEEVVVSDTLPGHLSSGKSSAVDIEVYTNEGQFIPHFHIKNTEGFSCCIKIYECGYFVHGHHKGTLNNKQAKFINNILRKDFGKSRTVWQEIVRVWEKLPENVSNDKLPDPSKQPDYSRINE